MSDCHYSLLNDLQLIFSTSMACPENFLSSLREKHPDPKSGQDLGPDKLGCITSCQGGETYPYLSHTFSGFLAPIFDSANSARVVGLVVGPVTVKQSDYC